jgi:ketosteroid isomerase-like protein
MTAGMSENEKIVLRSFEAFEAADERAMRGLVTSDFVVHSVPEGFGEDADGYVQLAQDMKAGLPDYKLDVQGHLRGWG